MPKSPLGPAVISLRTRKAWSVEDLAAKAHVKVDTLRALEQGTRVPRHVTIRKIAGALGVSPEALAEEAAANAAAPSPPATLDEAIEAHRAFRVLAQRTKIAGNRANFVSAGINARQVTLEGGLYVRRGVEDETLRLILDATIETNLIVIEGEPGAGKSSLLWSLQRELEKNGGVAAWLIDAVELAAVFGDDAALSSDFAELFQLIVRADRRPVLMIDTVDVALNARDRHQRLIALLLELMSAGVRVAVASRPGEARMLLTLGCRTMRLMDYSDDEFRDAVDRYARAFVRSTKEIDPERHAAELLDAAAQGYPIKEICRNPLTLRMLYSVYAPALINFSEVDVVSLYRAYWQRRVESDARSEAPGPRAGRNLSSAAMRAALVMLVEGLPELPVDTLARELEKAGLSGRDLQLLEARGVVRNVDYGSTRAVEFFHQTFFEHAAALGLLRFGGPAALKELAERWRTYRGNLFLAAVFERALVLAEYEPIPVRREAERILGDLDKDASGLAVLVYAFVHRSGVPSVVEEQIRRRIADEDSVVVERMLDIGANASRSRRRVLIEMLQVLIATESSRWMRRALELLVRFSSPDMGPVGEVVKRAALSERLIEGADVYPQVRDLYLEFLGRYLAYDPEWSLNQLATLFSDCLKRRADDPSLQILRVLRDHCVTIPDLASAFERRAGVDSEESEDVRTSEAVAREFGELFRSQWLHEGKAALDVLRDLETERRRGLSLTARLNGLVTPLLAVSESDLAEAFRISANVQDPALRAMLARITWTGVLPEVVRTWSARQAQAFFRQLRQLCAGIFSTQRTPAADIAFHVVGHAPITKRFAELLVGKDMLSDPDPWLSTAALGRRLIEGCVAKIPGAEQAMVCLTGAPERYPRLAQAALAQMRLIKPTNEMVRIGMDLAAKTRNTEATFGFLQMTDFCPEWTQYTPIFRAMVAKLRSYGDVKARRQAIAMERELTRLRLDPELNWANLSHLLEGEANDDNQAWLIEALGHLVDENRQSTTDRLRWLLRFGKGKDRKARAAILKAVSAASYEFGDAIAACIEDMFDLAFEGDTDGSIVAHLSTPVFVLNQRGDPRVAALAEAFVRRCAPLSTQACRRACAKFRNLFILIMRRMDAGAKERLLSAVPGLDRYLARMIIQGAAESETERFGDHLKAISEDPKTHDEIRTLARRFLQKELRVSGLERWSELYDLVRA